MALPKQVREQIEATKAHFEQADETVAEANEPTAAADDAGFDAANDADNAAEGATRTEAVTEHKAEDENSETYAQRFRSLQGMFAREQANNRDLQARTAQLEQLLASLSQQSASNPPARTEQAETLVTEQDVEDYGSSIDVMRKVSREELRPLTGRLSQIESYLQQLTVSLNTSIVPQVQQVAQQQAVSAEDRFWQNLGAKVPNWQQINNDKTFHEWLLDVDPLTGTSRQSHLEQAQRNLDANRVAAFFAAFSEQTGKYMTNAGAQPNRSAQATELEKQVSPGKGRSANAAASSKADKTYSPNDIRKFFDDVRAGKYKGREAERNRLERDIFAAQAEGRIVVNA